MKRYSVRVYSSYCDEYWITAQNMQEAEELVDQYACEGKPPVDGRSIEHVAKHEFVEFDPELCADELDENDQYV